MLGRWTTMVVVLCSLAWASGAHAATITVTTTADAWADDGQCSLREAVAAANSDAPSHDCPAGTGTDTVVVPAGTYKLTRLPSLSPGGYIPLIGVLTVSGAGADKTIIDGNKTDRVFGTASSATITIEKLTVTNGVSSVASTSEPTKQYGTPGIAGTPGTDGGGIHNFGTLTLSSVIVRDNATGGGGLGGVSYGNDSSTSANGGTGTGGAGGTGGNGGGIANRGTLTIKDSRITGNATGNGGTGNYGFGGNGTGTSGANGGFGHGGAGGAGGSGGGIYSDGTLSISGSVVTGNKTGNGGYGGVGVGGNGAPAPVGSGSGAGGPGGGGVGGAGGSGAGVYATAATIADSDVSQNTAGSGGPGQNGIAGNGGNSDSFSGAASGGAGGAGGSGGGVFLAGAGDLSRVALTGNVAGTGAGGGSATAGKPGATGAYSDGTGGAGGAGGSGGGLGGAGSGARTLTDSTVDSNTTGTGATGGNYTGPTTVFSHYAGGKGGAAGAGGGIDATVPVTIARSTITANKLGAAGTGGNGPGFGNGAAGTAPAGAAINGAAGTRVEGTITALNQAPFCSGTIADGGNNIDVHADPVCPGPPPSGDLRLGALADNGGIAFTRALGAGSPAIDAYTCPAGSDQRGVVRPSGGHCDIGAYEFAPPVVTDLTATPNATGWTLSAKVTPNGLASVFFDYGTGTAYGSSTPAQKLSGGGAASVVSVPIAGLASLTTYHFRARATNTDGSATTPDETFTTTANAGGGATPGISDKVAPVLTKVKVSPSRFAVARGATAKSAKVALGTKLRFSLSEAAAVKLSFARPTAGKLVKAKKGKKKTCKAVKHAPSKRSARCTIYREVGSLTRKGVKGANVVRFTGRIGRKALRLGVYRLTVFAIDGAANRSKNSLAKFTVISAHAHH